MSVIGEKNSNKIMHTSSTNHKYLSVNSRRESCSHAQTRCIYNVVIVMCTQNSTDRCTKHADGVHVAVPNIRTSLLYKLYQNAGTQAHRATHFLVTTLNSSYSTATHHFLQLYGLSCDFISISQVSIKSIKQNVTAHLC